MPTYISLLRGINVGGNNKIKMADLKEMYASMNYKNIKSYIQSGNVLFDTRKKDMVKIENEISKGIKKTFGFDIEVILRTKDDFSWVVDNHPFASEDADIQKQIYVMFLKEKPTQEAIDKLLEKVKDWPEHFQVIDNYAFLHAVNGYGRTKLSGNFVERNLKVKATARNWRSINTILELAD